jgi:hypothetical protein
MEMEDHSSAPHHEESDEDEISASFFGNLTSILKWTDDGVVNERKNFDKFQNILLNVQNEKDIYAAWEKEHRGIIDNFQPSPDENPVVAEKVDWIESLPEVMILQLNRVKFWDNRPIKTTHRVPIMAELYPDRFLKSNS